MQISSLIDIIDGKLLNSPSISFIYSFKTKASKVKQGDLFIAKKLDDVELAVKNGAFAIIVESRHPIIDNEIAWIKVQSINLCLIQLVRFKLANVNLKAYYCDKICYDLLNIYANTSSKNIKFLPKKLECFIKHLDDLEQDDILISKDKNILDKIYPNNKNFNTESYEIKNLTEHSLFEASFSFNDFYFQKLKISSLYIPQFIAVSKFLDIEIDSSKLKSFNHLKPIFIDKFWDVTDFGKSEKFVIIQNDKDLLENEIEYMRSKYNYAKSIFITSKYEPFFNNEQIIVENIKDVKDVLKNNSFNAAYIYGYSYDDIYENLIKIEKQDSLF